LLFGGTFAPPHFGHVNAVEAAQEYFRPDRILIMPTAEPPHKIRDAVDTPEVRLEMCRAAFGHIEHCEVSSYEIDRGGISYTVDTLEYLHGRYKKILLLCGSDMLLTLDKWKNAERIFALASIVCMPRYDDDIKSLLSKKAEYEENFGADVTVIESDILVLSSTKVRKLIADGSDLSAILPAGVVNIIKRDGLYSGEQEK